MHSAAETLHLYEVWLLWLLLLLLLLLKVLLVEGGQVPRVPHADCAMSALGGKLQCPARHSDHPPPAQLKTHAR